MDGTKLIGPERYFSPGYWKGVRNQEIDKRQTKTRSNRQNAIKQKCINQETKRNRIIQIYGNIFNSLD